MEGLEAFTYALFTRHLGYSQEEVDVICADIRKEMKDPKMHAMFYLYVFDSQEIYQPHAGVWGSLLANCDCKLDM